jgi:hypothetical protein
LVRSNNHEYGVSMNGGVEMWKIMIKLNIHSIFIVIKIIDMIIVIILISLHLIIYSLK